MVRDRILYDALGIKTNATSEEIKKAFKQKFEPPEDEEDYTDEQFLIETAYNVLSHPHLREIYDRYGYKAAMKEIANMMENFDYDVEEEEEDEDDVYGFPFFKAKGAPNASGLNNSVFVVEEEEDDEEEEEEEEDIEEKRKFELEVSLKNLYTGCTLPLRVKMSVPCPHCNGMRTQSKRPPPKCKFCHGNGYLYTMLHPAFGIGHHAKQTCVECMGKGYMLDDNDTCRTCFGKGTVEKAITVQVNIEKGAQEGDIIEMKECPAIVVLKEKENGLFERRGNDLITRKNLTLSQALLGSIIVIEHLDGRKIVTSTIGRVIKPGEVLMIENEGFTIKKSMRKGNLHVIFNVQMPLSKQITPLLSVFLENISPRPIQPEGEIAEARNGSLEEFGNSPTYQEYLKEKKMKKEYEEEEEEYDDNDGECFVM